jgi:D-amino-acid dehydrogenase
MEVGIIGGGINGLFSAYYLQKMGYSVTILEQSDLLDSCSHGNAGMIVPSHIIPLAAPGMIAKGLKWMLSSTSPFYIRPRMSGSLLKWGWLFYKNATEANVQKSIPILRDISLLSKAMFQDFQKENHFDFGWHERGLMMLYQTPSMAHEEAEGAAIANKAGIEAHVLSAEEVQKLEPNTKVNAIGGVFYPGDAHLNPNLLVSNLKKYLTDKGVRFLYHTPVTGFEIKNHAVTGVLTAKDKYNFDENSSGSGCLVGRFKRKTWYFCAIAGRKRVQYAL